jgi:hypothetical protein
VIAIALCVVAFIACYWAGRRSLGQGLVMLFVFGYFYGILRANLLTTFSHFIFDAGLLGLYLSPKWRMVNPQERKRSEPVKYWTFILILWPALLVALPFQPFLISVVGLRGNVFFLPLLLLGSRMKSKDITELAVGLAALDMVALLFACAEYVLGVPRFFPYSAVTQIMYASGDVAGGFLRIPSTFTSAHAFGGTMVGTIPFLIGLWTTGQTRLLRLLGLLSIPAAMVGILMSATRTNFLFGSSMVIFVLFTIKMQGKQKFFFGVAIAVVAYFALTNVRFQRFKSLDDKEYITNRIAGSVNRGFFEILTEYPLGNGLGGGGTSMPYFLEGQVRNPIGMENEYARILAEQGIIGLLIWLAFLAWYFARSRIAFAKGPWSTPRRLLWFSVVIGFGTAWIGTGSLTSIPGTVLLVLALGCTAVLPEASQLATAPNLAVRRVFRGQGMPAPALR